MTSTTKITKTYIVSLTSLAQGSSTGGYWMRLAVEAESEEHAAEVALASDEVSEANAAERRESARMGARYYWLADATGSEEPNKGLRTISQGEAEALRESLAEVHGCDAEAWVIRSEPRYIAHPYRVYEVELAEDQDRALGLIDGGAEG